MTKDWTVDIPLRTPSWREASKEEFITEGLVLGHPADLAPRLMPSLYPGITQGWQRV